MINYITLLGVQHLVTQDGFGLTLIDGVPINEWMDKRTPAEMVELAHVGAKAMKEMPKEYLADVAERVEMPYEQWDMLSQMKDALDGTNN